MTRNAVPNIFTFCNLSCGIMSILMVFDASPNDTDFYKLACLFILLAAIIDRYDGRVARFLNVSSEIGKELDSLADLVSFGVAPSILVYNLNDHFSSLGLIGYILVLIFPLSGAYRLARYNTSNFDGRFVGVPITIAGVFMAFYSLILLLTQSTPNSILSMLLIMMFSYLMVSKFRFKKV